MECGPLSIWSTLVTFHNGVWKLSVLKASQSAHLLTQVVLKDFGVSRNVPIQTLDY